MPIPDELRRYVPRTDLYDSAELISYHMPVEQPPATASYIIFKKGNKAYAKNGVYGHIEYEDTDSANVIQNALDSLTENRTWKEKVLIIGNHTITKKITVPSYTILEIRGKLFLDDYVNDYMLEMETGGNDIMIIGGLLDGNGANQTGTTTPDIIHGTDISNFAILYTKVTNSHVDGIDLDGTCEHGLILGVTAYNNQGAGIHPPGNMRDFRLIGCTTYNNGTTTTRYGYLITTAIRRATVLVGCVAYNENNGGFRLSYASAIGCQAYNCPVGFFAESSRVRVIGCNIRDCTTGIDLNNKDYCMAIANCIENTTNPIINVSATSLETDNLTI